MIRQYFVDFCNSLNASGVRSFKQTDIDVLFKDLQFIGDKTFVMLSRDFLRLENPPRNLTGWFLNRAAEMAEHEKREEEDKGGFDEYTPEDRTLFVNCVRLAMGKLNGEFSTWSEWFNKKWETLSGSELTEHLRAVHKNLQTKQG